VSDVWSSGKRLHRFTPGDASGPSRFEAVPVEHGRMQMRVLDAMAWQPGEILLSTDAGLFVLVVKTGGLTRLEPPGVNGLVGCLARDRHGRVWLGGMGLWVLEPDGRARALHGALPFLGGQSVFSLTPCREADVLVNIEDRGASLVSLRPGTPAATEPEDELSRPIRPSHEQAVMAHVPWIREEDLGKQQAADKAFSRLVRELEDLVEARGVGWFGGVEYLDHYVLFFHGPDASALAASIAPRLEASDVVSSSYLVKRFGPPGSRQEVQAIEPKR
jgi:hypothetical protein